MSVAMEEWPRRHRITVEEYYRMAEVGLLAPDARVELIEGEIIDMPPIGSRHASAVSRLHYLLVRAAGDRAVVRGQSPVRLDAYSEPQPDLAVLAPRADFYDKAHPTPADALLIIEVSETTLRYDRQRKQPLYARHGIPELWIVDIQGNQLHVFRKPAGGEYTDSVTFRRPGPMPLALLPEVEVDLSALFS
ncbi:MAG TPA: Uma2 family endonuclease [Steroidobacteraceae bacterium]|jgi:Uma2 family endonuclease|nr:Uma2 family endonuclease [Steroidobacteraceae bacterium]